MFMMDQVPDKWDRLYSNGPSKPLDFIKQTGANLKYIFENDDFGSTIDVSKLFRPSALIVSLDQKFGSAEDLTGSKIIRLSTSGKVKLTGLMIMGADFSTKVTPAKFETNTLVKLPPLGISFVPEDETTATIPLYNSKSACLLWSRSLQRPISAEIGSDKS